MVWRDKTILTSPEVRDRAAVTSKTLRDSGRVSLLFSSSFSKTKGGSARQGDGAGRGGGGGREILTWLSWLFVCLIHIYIYILWWILILRLKASRHYFLFMEANKMKWSTIFTRLRLLNFSRLRCGAYSRAALFRKNCVKLTKLTSLDFDDIRATALIRVNTATVNSIRRNATIPSDMETLGDSFGC